MTLSILWQQLIKKGEPKNAMLVLSIMFTSFFQYIFHYLNLFRMKDDHDRKSHVRGVFAKSAKEADLTLHSSNYVVC